MNLDYIKDPKLRTVVEGITKKLCDDGRIIQAGFEAYRITAMSPRAPDVQVRECRMAWFAGAQHLFSSIMNVLDPGTEPTEADMERMSKIGAELDAFVDELKLRVATPEGNA